MVWFYNFSASAFHFYCPCGQFSFAVLHSLQLTRIGVKDHFQVCRTILLPYTVYHTDRLKKKQRIKGALGPLLLPFEAVFMQQLQNIETDRGREAFVPFRWNRSNEIRTNRGSICNAYYTYIRVHVWRVRQWKWMVSDFKTNEIKQET